MVHSQGRRSPGAPDAIRSANQMTFHAGLNVAEQDNIGRLRQAEPGPAVFSRQAQDPDETLRPQRHRFTVDGVSLELPERYLETPKRGLYGLRVRTENDKFSFRIASHNLSDDLETRGDVRALTFGGEGDEVGAGKRFTTQRTRERFLEPAK